MGLPGVTVQLRDDSGNLIATTVTDGRGHYNFNQFSGGATGGAGVSATGNDSVTLVVPAGFTQISPDPASILVSRGGISSLPDTILKEPLGKDAERVYDSTDHKGNWLACIKSGKPTICPPEVGHRSASICHLTNIGYRMNRKLKWDPKAERFVGDETANQQLRHEPRAKWKLV